MSDEMDDILKIFFEECDELLPELERGLSELSDDDASKETINAIFRAAHSIKGGAASFGLERLVRFAHTYESALDCLRSETVTPTTEIVRIFFSAMDVLSDLVAEAKGVGETVDDGRIDDTLKKLNSVIEQGNGPAQKEEASSEETAVPENFEPVAFDFDSFDFDEPEPSNSAHDGFVVHFKPHNDLYVRGDDARNLLLSLKELLPEAHKDAFEVMCEHDAVPSSLAELPADEAVLAWRVTLPSADGQVTEEQIREVFDWVDDVCDLTITPAGGGDDPDGGGETAPASEDDAPSSLAEETAASSVPPQESASSLSIGDAAAAERAVHVHNAEKPKPSKPARKIDHSPSIRVDLNRISMLMDMVGEMVIGQASLESVLEKSGALDNQELLKSLSVMRSLTRDIQGAIMAVRAQPVRNVFQRMHRVVREASGMAQKDIALVLEGEETEIDRTLIENLTDPLTHMLRNAVDHGVESPEKRRAVGKAEQGTIWLSAYHRSGRILIDIKDDGGGINRERVFQIAVQKGIVAPDAQLTENEVNELIFAPGFSTAEKVSDLSGRGVGMDVVKQAIQNLGGRVSIKSTPGEGTLFSLSLPLTLAVLDGMLIDCRGSTMVVPITSVVELMTVNVPHDVHVIPDGTRVILVRGRCIPLIYLADALTLPKNETREKTSQMHHDRDDQLIVLIVENEAGARAALVVDGIRDQAQVVIKSIEKNYRRIEGISAATILGDGSVSLILDVSTLIAAATRRVDTRAVEQYVRNAA